MTGPAWPVAATSGRPGESPRRRRRWRWVLGGAGVLLVLLVAGAAVAVRLQPSPAPLALPAGTPKAPSGSLAGPWHVAPGSTAGFRVRETTIGMSNYVAGRTDAVTGTAVLTGNRVTSCSFGINLTTVTVSGKKQPQFATSLGAGRYPVATVTLARPVALSTPFAAGRTVTITAPADLTLHGITRPVTVTMLARRDGPALQAAGTIPVTFAAWHIKGPAGYGPFGSLADHGTAEFLLVLHRS